MIPHHWDIICPFSLNWSESYECTTNNVSLSIYQCQLCVVASRIIKCSSTKWQKVHLTGLSTWCHSYSMASDEAPQLTVNIVPEFAVVTNADMPLHYILLFVVIEKSNKNGGVLWDWINRISIFIGHYTICSMVAVRNHETYVVCRWEESPRLLASALHQWAPRADVGALNTGLWLFKSLLLHLNFGHFNIGRLECSPTATFYLLIFFCLFVFVVHISLFSVFDRGKDEWTSRFFRQGLFGRGHCCRHLQDRRRPHWEGQTSASGHLHSLF